MAFLAESQQAHGQPASTSPRPQAWTASQNFASTTERGRTRQSQPWTSARCHRILRQLESRVATLRKLVSETDSDSMPARLPLKRAGSAPEDRERKRTRYTYGSRKNKPKIPDSKQSNIATPARSTRTLGAMKVGQESPVNPINFPTPACRRTHDSCHGEQESTSTHPSTRPSHAIPPFLTEEMRCWRNKHPNNSRGQIYARLLVWMGELLLSTEVDRNEPHGKSLLGMCLRRIPSCVDAIFEWEKLTSTDKAAHSTLGTSNVSLEIYEQLEAFGCAGLGWKPLKQALRSHCMSILNKAIAEELLEPRYAAILVRLCIHHGCADEAASLVLATPTNLPPPRQPGSTLGQSSHLEPLAALLSPTMCAGGKCTEAAFGCIASLLRDRRLPASWMVAKTFSRILTAAVESVSRAEHCSAAMELLATTTRVLVSGDEKLGLDPQGDDVQQTMVRISAGLAIAGMSVGSTCGETNVPWPTSLRRISRTAEECIKKVNARPQQAISKRHAFAFLLARRVACADMMRITSSEGAMKQLVHRDASGEGHMPDEHDLASCDHDDYRQALLLVCSVARGRSRERGCLSHDSLVEVCRRLKSLPLPSWFMQGLRTDGAFLLAQRTKDLRDLAFAERQIRPMEDLKQLEVQAGTMFSNWHWEDGIGEWVMRSPEDKRKPQRGAMVGGATRRAGTAPRLPQSLTTSRPHQTDVQPDGNNGRGLGAKQPHSRCDTATRVETRVPPAVLPLVPPALNGDGRSKEAEKPEMTTVRAPVQVGEMMGVEEVEDRGPGRLVDGGHQAQEGQRDTSRATGAVNKSKLSGLQLVRRPGRAAASFGTSTKPAEAVVASQVVGGPASRRRGLLLVRGSRTLGRHDWPWLD